MRYFMPENFQYNNVNLEELDIKQKTEFYIFLMKNIIKGNYDELRKKIKQTQETNPKPADIAALDPQEIQTLVESKKKSEALKQQVEKATKEKSLSRGALKKLQEEYSQAKTQAESNEENFNSFMKDVLISMMHNQNKEQLGNQEILDIYHGAVRSIPDTVLSVREKSQFLDKYAFPHLRRQLVDLSYDEELPALTQQKEKMITKINLREYTEAVKKTNYSDYIVLSIGLLRSYAKEAAHIKLLDEIERDYFELNYENCNEKIKAMALDIKTKLKKDYEQENDKQHEKELEQGEKQISLGCDAIINAQQDITEVDPDKNDTRRFFGVKLSQYMMGDTSQKEILASIDEISQAIIGKPVTNASQAEEAIASIAENEQFEDRADQLKDESPKYATKDRVYRDKIVPRETEASGEEFSEETIYSMNLGELRSNSPNFRDELAVQAIRNRIVDSNRPSLQKGSYTLKDLRHRAGFISSISGHTFNVVAVLEDYMKKYREKHPFDPRKLPNKLENDINRFLMAYIATYAKRGYHSMHEVLDVLREPNIIKVFKAQNVDYQFLLNPKTLNMAMNDTLAYSKNLSLKAVLHRKLVADIDSIVDRNQIKKLAAIDEKKLLEELKFYQERIKEVNIFQPEAAMILEKMKRVLTAVGKTQINARPIIDKLLESISDKLFSIQLEVPFKKKDFKTVKQLLADPAMVKDINRKTINQNSFITLAAFYGQQDLVMGLIDLKADKEARNAEGKTALMLAVEQGNLDFTKKLLAAKCDPLAKNSAGFTPFEMAVYNDNKNVANELLKNKDVVRRMKGLLDNGDTILSYCVSTNRVEMFEFLLGKGADPFQADQNGKGQTPFLRAAQNGNLDVVDIYLDTLFVEKSKTDAKFVTEQILAALIEAILNEKVDMAKYLIKIAKVDLNKPDKDGLTPLIAATMLKNNVAANAIVELLIQKRVNLNIKFKEESPEEYARKQGNVQLASKIEMEKRLRAHRAGLYQNVEANVEAKEIEGAKTHLLQFELETKKESPVLPLSTAPDIPSQKSSVPKSPGKS